MLDQIAPFVRAGFGIHWLHPRTKRPYEDKWTDLPVATFDALQATYRAGDNVGVRPGEPSQVDGGYLHILDVDIRVPELADEAMARLREMFPDVDSFPSVISGSGGASRHFYIISDKPFRSRLLAASESKFGRFDKTRGKTVWSNEWEIELFGSGKQVVMPPSIHPDTGNPYVWERPFDFDLLDLGFGPFVASDDIEALGVTEDTVYAFELVEPLTFAPGQMERDLSVIDVSNLHYDDWIRLGQAIHHQTGGSAEGFDLWLEHTKRSTKFTGDKQIREMRRSKWRSFGKYRKPPVTMATIRQWAQDARSAAMMAELDDLTDDDDDDEGDALDDDSDENFEDILGGEGDALSASDEFDAADAKAPKDEVAGLEWKSLLALTEKGDIAANLHNVRLIIENDPRTNGLMQFNEFRQEVVQRASPGAKPSRRKNSAKPTLQLDSSSFKVRDTANGDLWTDDKDNAIRAVFEAPKTQGGYAIKISDRDLRAAVDISARRQNFHPVREYLEELVWDGKQRAERLFIDYMGTPDNSYHRDVGRLMLLGAVARVYEPGCKFDTAVILEGLQGKRKSTFIKILARNWFVEIEGDFTDVQAMVELMQGAWIGELPELSGFVKADVRHVKGFLSRHSDKVRLAYARRAQEFLRQCIFVGSTNDDVYLKDPTGGRRFWPVRCTIEMIDTDRLEREIDQIWAETVQLYRQMRADQPRGSLPLYLMNEDSRTEAERLQESRQVESTESALAGQIREWLDRPITRGSVDDDFDLDGKSRLRNTVCLLEIWCECLGREAAQYQGAWPATLGRSMRMIGGWEETSRRPRFGKYGQQRAFERLGRAQRLED